MLTRPKILSKFVKGLFSVDEVFQVFFDAFHDFRYYLCNTREHINAIPIVALKTGVLFVEILEDLGLSVFMNKWLEQLCRDNRSRKGQFRGEIIRPTALPQLISLMTEIISLLFGGAAHIRWYCDLVISLTGCYSVRNRGDVSFTF